MKKFSLAFVLLILSSVSLLFSCKKINEATTLGGDLIPAVDNVNTFEVFLDAQTSNHLAVDSTKVLYSDALALGDINDPEFGPTHAGFDFNVTPATTGSYPFLVTDSLQIDSVVLSLSYSGSYGDTNSMQTVRVFEIDPNTNFRADTFYRYTDPASDFATAGTELGSASFFPRDLNDSVTVTRPKDTSKVVNVLRIRFHDNSLGERFAQYDTTNSSKGGFRSDSIFRTLFKGLAVKADNGGNALSYYNLADVTNTRLIVYFRAIKNGDTTWSSVNFIHSVNGQSNYIQRQFSSNLSTGGSDQVYIQGAPGSYASIVIPGLDAMSNKVIHRAEIIATRIPSQSDNIFTPPSRLLLDRISGDSSYLFEKDLVLGNDGSIGYDLFGGTLASNNLYRFNITRYVQSIVTRHQRNDTLRIWAPMRAYEFASNQAGGSYIQIPVNNRIAWGRVVLAGGNYADPNARLRLRIVYSNL